MIIVNGEERVFEENVTLSQFLEREGYRMDRIAVEINEEIVPKSQYDDHCFSDEDKIEIIHFVGGG